MSASGPDRSRRARQQRTLSPETLKSLYVRSDRSGALRLSLHVLLLAAGGTLIAWSIGSWWILPLLLVQGLIVVSLFATMHECVHYTAFATRWPNSICAFLAGAAILHVAPFYRHFHMVHHRHTQDPARDPELLAAPMPASRREFWLRVSGLSYWHLRLRQLEAFAVGRFSGLDYLDHSARREITRASHLLIAGLAFAAVASLWFESVLLVWCWLLPAVLGMPLLRLYLMCEHLGCEQSDDAFANTRTTLASWPVRLLMWNMPFHAEHHLYPNIPFHALPAAHRQLRPRLRVVAAGYWSTVRELYDGIGGPVTQ